MLEGNWEGEGKRGLKFYSSAWLHMAFHCGKVLPLWLLLVETGGYRMVSSIHLTAKHWEMHLLSFNFKHFRKNYRKN